MFLLSSCLPKDASLTTSAEIAPLLHHSLFSSSDVLFFKEQSPPLRLIPRFPAVFVPELSGYRLRAGTVLSSGDRTVNKTDKSPPSGAHGLVCACVCVHACAYVLCVCVCV